MTAGMAFEALNHGGDVEPDMLVILNDNHMSISENVGALTKMLARLMASRTLNRIREHGKKMMKRDGFLWRFVKRWEEHAKGMFVPSTLFEEFGFHYTGPIDGHDIPLLVSTMRTLKELKGPQLLHVITTKGKGYRAGRARADRIPRGRPVRSRSRRRQERRRGEADVHRDLRRLALRHGRGRRAPLRHHAGDARRLGPRALLEANFPNATSTSASPSSTR